MNVYLYKNFTYVITLTIESQWQVSIPYFGYESKGFAFFVQAEADAKNEIDERDEK